MTVLHQIARPQRFFSRMSLLCSYATTAISALSTASAVQDQVAGFSYTPLFTKSSTTGNDSFRFTPLVDISVTSLGYFDDGQNGLTFRHNVGIFNNEMQALITSVVIGPGTSSLVEGFQYEPVAPVTLFAGTEYSIVGFHPGSAVGKDRIGFAGFGSGLSLAPEICFGGYRSNSDVILSNPQGDSVAYGYFGANFRYNALATLPPNPPGTLINGGFERGDLSGWMTVAGSRNGVVGGGRTGFGEYESCSAVGPDTDIIEQTIRTTPGTAYLVKFFLAGGTFRDPDFNPDNVTDQSFRALWNGSEFFRETGREYHYYAPQSFVVTAAGTSSTLRFSSWNRFGLWQLDDVSVVAAICPLEPHGLG